MITYVAVGYDNVPIFRIPVWHIAIAKDGFNTLCGKEGEYRTDVLFKGARVCKKCSKVAHP